MRRIFFVSLSFFVLPLSVFAFVASDVTNIGAPSGLYYSRLFDIPVMDITIKSPLASSDVMTSVSVANSSTARNQNDIARVVLYADDGDAGWQGMGVDRAVAIALWDDSRGVWIFSGLRETLTSTGTRFFLAMETPTLSRQTSARFFIPRNGIVFASGELGPTDTDVVNADAQTLRNLIVNQYPPKSSLTNLASADVSVFPLTLRGIARAQGANTLASVMISITPAGASSQWNAATLSQTAASQTNWEYTVASLSDGPYSVQLQAVDSSDNRETIHAHPITVTTVTSPVVVTPPPLPPQPLPLPLKYVGQLVKSSDSPTVYFVASNSTRYSFTNAKSFYTWYADFSQVKTISVQELSATPVGGVARYRPGVRLVKIISDPKVYAVSKGGVLRHISSESLATSLYGTNWSTMIDDVDDGLLALYRMGDPIVTSADFNPTQEQNRVKTISDDL